jgi:glycine cleavage system H protein
MAGRNKMPNAEECKYTKSHEWVYLEGDIASCGISEYAQNQIGDIVFIELPKVGDKFQQGKQCAVIESVKAASDFYAPVSGEVVEVNSALADDPSVVNKSPTEDGWFFKIKVSDTNEVGNLMDFKSYGNFVQEQG